MKKKVIENHPWQYEGRKTSRKKNYYLDSYILDDQMLFLDCYDIREGIYRRVWRLVLTDDDHITYYADGSWSTAYIENTIGLEHYGLYSTSAKKRFEDFYISKDSEELVQEWISDRYRYHSTHLFKNIQDYQYNVRSGRRAAAEERHYTKLQQKARELPDLPDGFERWLKEKLYKDKHIMFYKDGEAHCSRCGRSFEISKKYKHNDKGICPKCRRKVIYKSSKLIDQNIDDCEVLIIQGHNDQIVFRYVKTALIQSDEEKERIQYTESVRTYHDDFLRYKSKLIHFFDNMVGGDFWSDKNQYYHQVVYGKNTCLYTGNRAELETILNKEWLDILECFTNEYTKIPIISFITMGSVRLNVCEKLFKAGFKKLTKEYIKGNIYSLKIDESELKKVMRLSKPLFNWAQANDIALGQYVTLVDAYEGNYGLSDEEIIELANAKIGMGVLKTVVKNRKIMKTFHYLQKAAGYKDINDRMRHYRDYLNMATAMHYDLNNDTVRYPKDIKAAHDKATSEFNLAEADLKKQEALKKYPCIAQISQTLESIYGYKDKTYEIIPPENAADIIEEGRILHHCVGGDNYLSSHNSGRSFILFMRMVSEPDKRYYTIEIDPKDQKIKQYYGAYDKKPDKEEVDKFLNKWKRNIKEEYRNGINGISELCAV